MARPRRAATTPNGRPVKPIDWEVVDQLLLSNCSGAQIAGQFDMHPHTFYDRCVIEKGVSFTDYSISKMAKGAGILKHHQYRKALGLTKVGDTQMLIHMGKHILNQRDTSEIAVNEDTAKTFIAVMNQLQTARESRSIQTNPEDSSSQ